MARVLDSRSTGPDGPRMPRRAFSLVEVCVALVVMGSASLVLSTNFRTGDALVGLSNDVSWACRLASQQSALVRRVLSSGAPLPAGVDTIGLPSHLNLRELATGDFDAAPPSGGPISIQGLGAVNIDVGSPYYLLNAANTPDPEVRNLILFGHQLRMTLLMTQVKVTGQANRAGNTRGLRNLVACQVTVFKVRRGLAVTPANDPGPGEQIYSMSFLARRRDLDKPAGVGGRELGFF